MPERPDQFAMSKVDVEVEPNWQKSERRGATCGAALAWKRRFHFHGCFATPRQGDSWRRAIAGPLADLKLGETATR
jgi:hypothetical protein